MQTGFMKVTFPRPPLFYLCADGTMQWINPWIFNQVVYFLIINTIAKLQANNHPTLAHVSLQTLTRAHVHALHTIHTHGSKGGWSNWNTTACFHLRGPDYSPFFLFLSRCLCLLTIHPLHSFFFFNMNHFTDWTVRLWESRRGHRLHFHPFSLCIF